VYGSGLNLDVISIETSAHILLALRLHRLNGKQSTKVLRCFSASYLLSVGLVYHHQPCLAAFAAVYEDTCTVLIYIPCPQRNIGPKDDQKP
jgi:hypothetical protein